MNKISALISIQPNYVNKIFAGAKHYEYRKRIFAQSVSQVYIYSSSPVKKIVGEFKIETILSLPPAQLWLETEPLSGIEKTFFDIYFRSAKVAHAIKITNLIEYNIPFDLNHFGIKFAPQSFVYVNTLQL
jgi:predicted transcriptional regulator